MTKILDVKGALKDFCKPYGVEVSVVDNSMFAGIEIQFVKMVDGTPVILTQHITQVELAMGSLNILSKLKEKIDSTFGPQPGFGSNAYNGYGEPIIGPPLGPPLDPPDQPNMLQIYAGNFPSAAKKLPKLNASKQPTAPTSGLKAVSKADYSPESSLTSYLNKLAKAPPPPTQPNPSNP